MATCRYGYMLLWLHVAMATCRYGYTSLWLLAVRVYLYDEQEEEVAVGHSQELLKEVEGEECNDIVLRRRHHIVLNTKK